MNRDYDPHPRYQPRNLKNGTTHITNTEEDHITEVDKLIKITISFNLKSEVSNFPRRIEMQEIFYGQGYQEELLVSSKFVSFILKIPIP